MGGTITRLFTHSSVLQAPFTCVIFLFLNIHVSFPTLLDTFQNLLAHANTLPHVGKWIDFSCLKADF